MSIAAASRGNPACTYSSTALVMGASIISKALGIMPLEIIELTAIAPACTELKPTTIVETCGGFCRRRTSMAVAIPNIPSLPMNAPRRSNREFSESKTHTSPDGSTTSRERMCAEVTPSDRQCGPPELFATFPPMVQLCWLEGSGAKCKPNCEVWRDRSAFSTPGSTHAVRL